MMFCSKPSWMVCAALIDFETDVPDAENIICLFTENQDHHMMTLPFLAGLEIMGGPMPANDKLRQATCRTLCFH